jgi:tetratricopeptide (TPR) repeat protein
MAIIVIASGYLVFVNYVYHYYIIGAYHNYPEPVAKQLRRAVYYMKTDLRPDDALKYFKQALQACEDEGMDPMSDEVMGIRIEVSRLMEIIHRYDKSVEVLERIRADNMRWLEAVGGREENKVTRTRVLTRTIAINVKLAELYTNGAIWKRDLAQERLVWAVETVYRERQRRRAQNVTDEEEGPWMSDDEIGATDERLAQTYAEQDQHYLAVPLYLQCLQLKSATDCHSVTLMSNLATSLAQQSPRAAREAQAFAQSRNVNNQSGSAVASGPMATRESLIEDAQQWAQKALSVARELRPPERTEECDMGCVVAMHNLGEFAEMLGDKNEARRRYEEAVSLAKGIGFVEGVENGTERLKELAAS